MEELPLASFLRGEGKSPPCGGWGPEDWRGLCDRAALPFSIHGVCPPRAGDRGWREQRWTLEVWPQSGSDRRHVKTQEGRLWVGLRLGCFEGLAGKSHL